MTPRSRCSATRKWTMRAFRTSRCRWWRRAFLKDFLRTRQPVRGYNDSNGRARLTANYGAGTVPTNLLISARETSSIADLKKKLIDLIDQRGLPYGMIVRKMDFPSSASIDEARKILSAGTSGQVEPPCQYAALCLSPLSRRPREWFAACGSQGKCTIPQGHSGRRRRQRYVQLPR